MYQHCNYNLIIMLKHAAVVVVFYAKSSFILLLIVIKRLLQHVFFFKLFLNFLKSRPSHLSDRFLSFVCCMHDRIMTVCCLHAVCWRYQNIPKEWNKIFFFLTRRTADDSDGLWIWNDWQVCRCCMYIMLFYTALNTDHLCHGLPPACTLLYRLYQINRFILYIDN